jgi:anti-sigma regulatory factor (Ser/Thr protein kinase)
VSVRIAATMRAPSEARRAVSGALAGLAPGVAEETELLVTELVTNAVRHGGLSPDDTIELHLTWRSSVLRVEVADGGPGFDPASALETDPEAVGGWGLLLVSRMASRWGVTRGRPNVAWFEIDLTA